VTGSASKEKTTGRNFKGEMIKELTLARKVTPAKQSLHIDPRKV
jgi:hypothetical protein